MVELFLKGRGRWEAVKTSTFKVEMKAGTIFKPYSSVASVGRYYLTGPLTPLGGMFIYLFKQLVCFASVALRSCVVPTAGKENLRKDSRHLLNV